MHWGGYQECYCEITSAPIAVIIGPSLKYYIIFFQPYRVRSFILQGFEGCVLLPALLLLLCPGYACLSLTHQCVWIVGIKFLLPEVVRFV